MARVVVTGMGGMSPIGASWQEMDGHFRSGRNAIRAMDEWRQVAGLNSILGAPLPDFQLPAHYDRKKTRSMGRLGILATRSSELALEDAGLLGDPILASGKTGVAYGSSSGVPGALAAMGRVLIDQSTDSINANTYIQIMPHTTAVNVSVFFGVSGRLIPTSTACTSGSLAIGLAYEAIKHGKQTVMIAGGAEEISVSQTAVFDTLFATSTQNDSPDGTPRPFDADRDGMVVGEGGASFVLEDMEFALARGAKIHAEIVGFGTNADGRHVTQPSAETMSMALKEAIDDSGIDPSEIGYVSAHGTATDLGDVAESHATRGALGRAAPISSMKSFVGHTLGACGSIEAWMAIEMMNRGWFAPTLNLRTVDPRCAELDYIMGEGREMDVSHVMSNNFAFGGVNTSLIFRRWAGGAA